MDELSGFERNVGQAVRNAAAEPGHYKLNPQLIRPFRPDDADTPEKMQALLTRAVTRRPDQRAIMPEGIDWVPAELSNVFQGSVTDTYRKAQLARIAACVGLSYFTVSGDLSSANFSSLQQGNLDNRALFRAIQNLVLESMKQIVKKWVLWQTLRSSAMQRIFGKMLANPDEEIRYIKPPFEYIDRVKSAMADKADLENKTNSRSAVILAHGQDPQTVDRQIVEDEKRLRDLYEEYDIPYPGDNNSLTDGGGNDNVDSAEDTDDQDNRESEKNK